MLILTNAGTDLLELVTSATVSAMPVHASWVDLASGVVTPGRTNTSITTAATTTIVATPAASTTRNVKYVNVRNADATTTCNVTVRFNQNSTTFEVIKVVLLPGDVLEFVEGIGWFVVTNSTGAVTLPAGTTTVAPLTFTSGTSLTTPAVGTAEFDGVAFYRTADTTNGRRFDDAWNYFRLTSSGTGITTIADFFGTNDGIPMLANGVYEIEWVCYFSQATAGTATWTVVTATTALANLTGEYIGSAVAGIGAVGTPQMAAINTTASSSTAFPVTGTEATAATHCFKIRVLATAGAGASNTRLRLTMSAGTATPLINSYFRVRRLAAANVGTFVA